MKEAEEFFEFVNEREAIRILKESGSSPPWTHDPILQEFRFCNVFREDDRTTKYFRETVRDPLRDRPEVLIATIGWRWFNRIETCSRVTLGEWRDCDIDGIRAALRDPKPLVTGAFLVVTPAKMSKLEGILWCLRQAKESWIPNLCLEQEIGPWTLKDMHTELMRIPYLGRFMAYEVVTDLRHTYLLEDASDTMTWASAGPGCLRGAGWVFNGDPDAFKYGTKKAQSESLKIMHHLLWFSEQRWEGKPWEMREVEHCLCEYDKYRRAQNGQRLKRKYQ